MPILRSEGIWPKKQEFLKQYVEAIPAVIVTDVRMSSMSRVELQTKLLNQGRKIPFVFIGDESTVPQAILIVLNNQ